MRNWKDICVTITCCQGLLVEQENFWLWIEPINDQRRTWEVESAVILFSSTSPMLPLYHSYCLSSALTLCSCSLVISWSHSSSLFQSVFHQISSALALWLSHGLTHLVSSSQSFIRGLPLIKYLFIFLLALFSLSPCLLSCLSLCLSLDFS